MVLFTTTTLGAAAVAPSMREAVERLEGLARDGRMSTFQTDEISRTVGFDIELCNFATHRNPKTSVSKIWAKFTFSTPGRSGASVLQPLTVATWYASPGTETHDRDSLTCFYGEGICTSPGLLSSFLPDKPFPWATPRPHSDDIF